MTTLKTTLNERPATDTPFTPTADIAESNVQEAIEAVVALANASYQPLDADLTAVAALTTTAAGRSTLTIADPNADRILAWDDSAGTVAPIALADLTTEAAPATGDFLLIYGAEGDLRKADWSTLPAGGGISDGDKGDITVSGSGATLTVDNNAITDVKIRDSAALSVIGRSANSTGDPADIAAANDGEVLRRSGTTLGFGTVATAGIADDAVTNAKLANVATSTLKGRLTASTGDPEDLTIGNGFYSSGTTLSAIGVKNRLINGCFRFNQRQATSNADDTYAHDRWNILTQTGTVAASTQTLVEDGTVNMMRITQSQASAQRFGVEQILEAANTYPLRGKAVTLSARVRMSASTTLRYAILEWTGTADAVTSDVVNDWTSGTFTAGNFFKSTTTTVTATGSTALTANTLTDVSLSTTLGSSCTNVIVMFWTDSTQAQNVTLDIGNAQLEPGSVATSFENRQPSIELILCQRYYEKSYSLTTAPGTATGTGKVFWYCQMSSATISNAGGHIVFKVEKWATPTLTGYSTTSGASGKFRSVGNAADVNSNFDEPNQYGTGWFATLSAASTAGNIQFQYVAEIEL